VEIPTAFLRKIFPSISDSGQSIMKNITYLIQVLEKKKGYTSAVIAVLLLSTLFECFSFSLIFPIAQAVLYGTPDTGFYASILSQFQKAIGIDLFLPFICLLMLAAVVLKSAIGLISLYMSKKLALQMRTIWMNSIFEKYMNSHISNVIIHKQGELIHNLVNETRRASLCLVQSIQYITRFMLTAALLGMLFLSAPKITAIISILALSAMGVMFFLKSYAKKVGIKRQKLLRQITESATEGIGGIRQIKTLGLESFTQKNFSSKSNKLFNLELKFETLRIVPAKLIELFIALIIVSVILYIYFLTDIDIKTIIPTLALVGVVGIKILGNTAKLSSLHWQIIALLPAVKKIEEEVALKTEQDPRPGGKTINSISEDILLKNIDFKYEGDEKSILKKLNITIPNQKLTVIAGPSGSGKSTIADLIIGFISPTSGEIIVNGKLLSYWNMKSWRNIIGYVSQETFLFHDSIKANIAVGRENCNETDIVNAAEQAHAHQFISSLPNGYDTVVGERGTKLSGGQRQKIAIARALIRNPELLIFDEPTSALDHTAEEQIIEVIKELAKTKMILLITHREKIIQEADNIYKLEE